MSVYLPLARAHLIERWTIDAANRNGVIVVHPRLTADEYKAILKVDAAQPMYVGVIFDVDIAARPIGRDIVDREVDIAAAAAKAAAAKATG